MAFSVRYRGVTRIGQRSAERRHGKPWLVAGSPHNSNRFRQTMRINSSMDGGTVLGAGAGGTKCAGLMSILPLYRESMAGRRSPERGAFRRRTFICRAIFLPKAIVGKCVDVPGKLDYKPANRGGLLAARMFYAPGARPG